MRPVRRRMRSPPIERPSGSRASSGQRRMARFPCVWRPGLMLETARWRTMSPPICRPAGNTLSRVRPRIFSAPPTCIVVGRSLSRAQPRITRSPLTRRPVGSPSSLGQFWSSRSPSTCRSSGRLRRSASLMTVRCRRGAAALGAELTRARGPARPPERRGGSDAEPGGGAGGACSGIGAERLPSPNSLRTHSTKVAISPSRSAPNHRRTHAVARCGRCHARVGSARALGGPPRLRAR